MRIPYINWAEPRGRIGYMCMNMDLGGLCQDYVNGQSAAESPRLIAKSISSGQVELVKVVEALEIYLTSTNVNNRSLGTKLLSEVLTQVDPSSLNSDEVHYIVAFYCDRLKDKAIVIPHVLTGMHALVTQYSLSDADVVTVCRTIFKEIFNQSQQFPERRFVCAIMDHFLTNHLQAVQLMSSEFVLGYIQAIDGERDPRNLLSVFHSVYLIVLHLQFDTLAEELFEVTSCYFPIDFTPPSNDPLAVTKEALVLSLRKCLTATEKFAEFCLPLLLDKLTSDLPSAKLDALCTLADGVGVYGASQLHPFLQPLWTTIKREMFQSPDEQIERACVAALTSMTKTLSQPLQLTSSENHLNSFVAMVLKDCKRHLAEPELRLITPTVHLLRAIAVASDPACTYVVSSVLPSLIQQASIETKVSQQRVLLEALLIFITATNQFTGGGVTTPLVANKDALLKLLMSASTHQESSIQVVTMTTLGALLQTHEALERSEAIQCSEHLKEVALSDQDASVRGASCSALALFASVDPDIVTDTLLPSILSLMADSRDASVQAHVVDVLAAMCVVHPSLLELGIPSLVQQFGHLLRAPSPDIQLASTVSSALVHITRTCISWEFCQNLLSGGLLRQLVAVCVISCDIISPLLENIGTVLSLFTQAADESCCGSLLTWLMGVLVNGEVSVSDGSSPLPPLSLTTPPNQSQLIALLSAVLGAAAQSVTALFSDGLLPVLKQLSYYCEHDPTYQHAAKCYATIVNKLPQSGGLSFLDEQLSEMWTELSIGESSPSTRLRVLNVFVWVSKALLMRGHPSGMDTATKLLSLCVGSSELGSGAADGFQILMADTEYMLNLKCHANVRLFYKQQLFMQVVPKLVELFKSHRSSEHRVDHLLRALSHLMQGVPKEVLLAELPTVIPLLLESMTSEDVGLKESTLNGIHSLIADTPQSVIEHVPALVPRLLQLARDPTSMKVRICSLSCIGSLTSLPTHIVYPYQTSIIQQLGTCLDDHKRLVRKEAVDARGKWYLLGTLYQY